MNNQTTTVKCSVNVYNPVKLKSFNLSNKNISLQPGKSTTIKRVINPTNATIIKVAYATSNKKVATVNSKGVVVAKGIGSCKICCAIKTYDGKIYKRYAIVKVSKLVEKEEDITEGENAKEPEGGKEETEGKPEDEAGKDSEEEQDKETEGEEELTGGKVTIKYIDKETNKEAAQLELKSEDKFGEYTYKAKKISGYMVVGADAKTVSLSKEKDTAEITFEYVKEDAVPYIATVYSNPDLGIDEDVILKFYATDFNHKAYLTDNYTEKFDIEVNVKGKISKMTRNAGESSVNLGKMSAGEYWYTIQAKDQYGRKSAEMYGEFRVEDKVAKAKLIADNTYYVTEADLVQYGISNQDSVEESLNTKNGLQKLFNDLADRGVRKCVLLKGTYRLKCEYNDVNGIQSVKNVLRIPSNFILDLNGSTIKQDTTPHEQSKAYLMAIDHAYDAHVTNGILEGDYGDRDLTKLDNGYPSGEQIGCAIISGESKYSSFNNLTVRKFSGYAMSIGLSISGKHADSKWKQLTNWQAIDIDESGNEIKSDTKYTSDYNDISGLENIDTLRVGKYLGYQFSQDGDEWVVKYHFYDKDKKYIKTTIGHQYRSFVKPKEAAYLRATYICSDVKKLNDIQLYAYHIYSPMNSSINNVKFEDTRTCALNPCQGNNVLIENCTFTRTATNITPVAIDFEDGWNLMQDYCLKNNEVIERVGTGDIVVVGGMNLQFENNKNFRFGTRSCTPGIVFRNNENCSGGVNLTDRLNTGYYRYYNNKNVEYIESSQSNDLPYKIYNCTFKKVAASANQYTEFIGCEFDWDYRALPYNTGGIVTGKFTNCTLKNYIDPNNNFLHIENAYFDNCTIENMTMNVNGNVIFNNCNIKNLTYGNYVKDINLQIKNSNVHNFVFNFAAWAKCKYDILFENSTFENDTTKNIFSDAFGNYSDTKEFKVQSKNCKYINGTVIANENVMNNTKINFSIN